MTIDVQKAGTSKPPEWFTSRRRRKDAKVREFWRPRVEPAVYPEIRMTQRFTPITQSRLILCALRFELKDSGGQPFLRVRHSRPRNLPDGK